MNSSKVAAVNDNLVCLSQLQTLYGLAQDAISVFYLQINPFIIYIKLQKHRVMFSFTILSAIWGTQNSVLNLGETIKHTVWELLLYSFSHVQEFLKWRKNTSDNHMKKCMRSYMRGKFKYWDKIMQVCQKCHLTLEQGFWPWYFQLKCQNFLT